MKSDTPDQYAIDSVSRGASLVCTSHPRSSLRVLVVDADTDTRNTLTAALQDEGFLVEAASTPDDALAAAHRRFFDFLILDRPGLDVARSLAARRARVRFILVGSALTVPASVEAMKLGAIDVLEKPVMAQALVDIVRLHTRTPAMTLDEDSVSMPAPDQWPIQVPHLCGPPRSAAQRWAMHVVKACESEDDLKTLKNWAKSVGVSYSSLCESCRLLGIRPHDARDFARALWVVVRSSVEQCTPGTLLDVSDRRTLRAFLEKAGPRFLSRTPTMDQFLRDQRFIAPDNEGVRAIRKCFRCPPSAGAPEARRAPEGALFRGNEKQTL